jgi:hypothetical protein
MSKTELKNEQFIEVQNKFKVYLENKVGNGNSKTSYACASRHFLLFCENEGITDVTRIHEMISHWHKSLKKGVITYKRHLRNYFIPYLISQLRSSPVQDPAQDEYTNNEYEPPRKRRRIYGPLRINIALCQKSFPKRRRMSLRQKANQKQDQQQPQYQQPQYQEHQEEVQEEYDPEYDPSKISVMSLLFLMYMYAYAIVSM